MDETSSRETFEQEDTEHTIAHDNPKSTHSAHQQLKTTETLPNVEQPDVETNPTIKKETKKMSTSKPTSLPRNILSQEKTDALKKTNPHAYMKMVLSSKGSSIDRCSSSSTVSVGNNGLETIDEVMKQLKA